MKKYWLFTGILCIIIVSSCKKSSSSGSSSGSSYYVSSTVSMSTGTRIVDSFQYDGENRISQFIQYKYDTSTGTAITTVATTSFSLPTGSAPATGYVYTINGNSLTHTLSYDNQNRVIKDTCPTTGYVAYFTYPNGNIASTVLFDGTAMNNQIDTLYMSAGNIATADSWEPNDEGTADSLQGSLKFGYSSVANPSYHSAITGTVGPVLYLLTVNGLGGGLDPISEKSMSSISGAIDGLTTAITINFTQTTDSKGRLSQLYGSLFTYSETIDFNYYSN
jgi:hypothetical protein